MTAARHAATVHSRDGALARSKPGIAWLHAAGERNLRGDCLLSERVPARCLRVVEPFGWEEFGVSAVHADFPVLVVDQAVVFAAEEHQVV